MLKTKFTDTKKSLSVTDRDFHLHYKKVLGLRTSALLLVKELAVDSAYGLVSVC